MKTNDEKLKALELFSNGYLCSEAVLMDIAKTHNINSPLIPNIATAFGRGLANGDSVCGALSGGILALSMMQGRQNAQESFELLYKNIAGLKESFGKEFGAHECSVLLGFSLNDTDAKEKFMEQNCKTCKCSNYISFTINHINEMIKSN